jgi:hypothetical protein
MPVFGDKNTFAIDCFVPGHIPPEEQVLIYCHLVLGNQYIGLPDDPDLLGTCGLHLKKLKEIVLGENEQITHSLFDSLSDREILELIWKANQSEEEFDPGFNYLPNLESERLWSKHTFMLGESLDQYYMAVIDQFENIKFIWTEGKRTESELYVTISNRDFVISTIDDCLTYMKQVYPERFSWL